MWWKFAKREYYHASPQHFKPGDHIMPIPPERVRNYQLNDMMQLDNAVYLTSAPEPHYTIADRAIREGWNIYKVRPTQKCFIGNCWDEYRTYGRANS